MFNFNPNTKYDNGTGLIPNGVCAFAVVSVEKTQYSQNTNGLLASLSLTISTGKYAGRKIFTYIGDPSDTRNSEKYRTMSLGQLQAMLEAAGVFDPARPETYQAFANASFTDILRVLDGKTVAIKIGIEKGQGGYEDRNRVSDYLTPNPVSRSSKKFQELMASPEKCLIPAERAPGDGAAPWATASAQQAAAPAAQSAPAVAAPAQSAPAAPAAAPGAQPPAWLTGGK